MPPVPEELGQQHGIPTVDTRSSFTEIAHFTACGAPDVTAGSNDFYSGRRKVIQEGEIIEDYPEDARGHSFLVLGLGNDRRPIHIVCAPKRRISGSYNSVYTGRETIVRGL